MKSIYPIESKDYSKEEYKKEILIRDLITNLKKDFSDNNYEIIAGILESIPTQNLIGWMPEEYLEEFNKEKFLVGVEAQELCNHILKNESISSDRFNIIPNKLNLGFWEENGNVVAFDNTDGNCWVEEFDNLESALNWLNKIEFLFYDLHVQQGKSGFSIPIMIKSNLVDYLNEENILTYYAVKHGLLDKDDASDVDYVEEIDEEEYKRMKGV